MLAGSGKVRLLLLLATIATAGLVACGEDAFCENRDEVLDAEICYQPDPNDCSRISGCSRVPACIGKTCPSMDQSQCEDDRSCVWIESLGCRQRVVSGQYYCLSFTTPLACEGSQYCVWDVACDGKPERLDCGRFDDEGSCEEENLQCVWHTRNEFTF